VAASAGSRPPALRGPARGPDWAAELTAAGLAERELAARTELWTTSAS